MTLYTKWLKDKNIYYHNDRYIKGYESIDTSLNYRELESGKVPSYKNYRDEAIETFSFAILDSTTVERLRKYGPYLEVGCGTGYWAYELWEVGVEVIATDPNPLSDTNKRPKKIHVSIEPLTAEEALDKYGSSLTLLTVWPSLYYMWPAEALEKYTQMAGQKIVYVGEGSGGCTADDEFHRLLDNYWEEVERIYLPTWYGVHDVVYIYSRKQ